MDICVHRSAVLACITFRLAYMTQDWHPTLCRSSYKGEWPEWSAEIERHLILKFILVYIKRKLTIYRKKSKTSKKESLTTSIIEDFNRLFIRSGLYRGYIKPPLVMVFNKVFLGLPLPLAPPVLINVLQVTSAFVDLLWTCS